MLGRPLSELRGPDLDALNLPCVRGASAGDSGEGTPVVVRVSAA